ncbi:MAG: hypothetical protein IJO85_07525 [Lachnospiraceae bacterium]|nr:hypothetical protein [Lachnospiraceae bacterium]
MAAGYDGSIRINTQIETKNINSQMMKVVNSISKTEKEIANLRNKMKQLEFAKIPTQEYVQLQKELASAETKADSLYGKLRILEKTGANRTSASFLRLKEQIAEADERIDALRMGITDLESSGAAFTSGVDSAEYKKAADKVEELSANLKVSHKRLTELNKQTEETSDKFAKIKDKAQSAFKSMIEGSKKSSKTLSTLGSRTRGILLSLLIFNNITKAFNSMVGGMKEGFNNLVIYADDYNVAMSQLKSSNTQMKNSLATAFGSIVQMAIPHLITLINYVTEASNRVAQFTAVLAGKDSWTKAVAVQEDYAESLSGTASAAKKAKGVLASFDTLEVLNKKDTSTGGTTTNPKDMFEEVPIENAEITSIAERFKQMVNASDWEGIGTLLSDKLKKSMQDIEWQKVYSNADMFGSGLAAFLNGLVKPATFKEVGKTTAGSLNTCLHFLNSFGKDFEWGKFGESLSEGVKGFLMEWDAELTGETFSTFASGLLQAATEAIETTGDNDTFEVLGQKFVDLICGIQWGDLTWDLINFFVALQDAAGELPADFARGIAEGILKKITGQENLEIETPEWLNNIIEAMLKGPLPVQPLSFVKMILPDEQEEKEQLAQFLGRVYQWLDGDIRNLFTKEKWQELTTGLKEGLAANWEEFEILWEESGAALWWEEDVAPWFTVEKWAEVASGISEGISTKWDETSETWKTNIKSWWEEDVVPWFTVEKWKTIGENMKKGVHNGFYGIVSKTVDVANGIISSCENMVNKLIDKINSLVQEAQALANKVPGMNWELPTLNPISFGRVQAPDIPALADGDVIRGGNPFLAILGDQPHGQTNIEAPLSTIEEAVSRAVGGNNGTGPLIVELYMDSEKFARLFMDNWMQEASRRGLNVDILEGNT